ncbi:DUF7556 family protein [Halopiger xanaduensis]|uniref:Uncharacterized protein n=1 Tax=Halopiger xanaduensis (strain DSM 18323 / JCM 14033 / SH-6) TaxID=797210 RepID=F8D4K3_HALXS|nr:hypothetical protein [Halopiger xanaduensis]AEH36331.1 hypothetical protein Halxa_1700 [Halopiger xanaduensis SH-6]
MAPDARSVEAESADSREVVAAIDESDDESRLVIADITRDGVWLSTAETDAASLEEWR